MKDFDFLVCYRLTPEGASEVSDRSRGGALKWCFCSDAEIEILFRRRGVLFLIARASPQIWLE